jgi:hypothetical protein
VEWEKQKSQLADLVVEINKPLKKLDRATLITLCTIDVHARDVLGRLIDDRVEDMTCFQWQSQLRYIVHEKTKKCQVQPPRDVLHFAGTVALEETLGSKRVLAGCQTYQVVTACDGGSLCSPDDCDRLHR